MSALDVRISAALHADVAELHADVAELQALFPQIIERRALLATALHHADLLLSAAREMLIVIEDGRPAPKPKGYDSLIDKITEARAENALLLHFGGAV